MTHKEKYLRRLFLASTLAAAVFVSAVPAARATVDEDIALIRTRILEPVIRPVDTARTETLLTSMKTDGSWPDVDYADQNSANWRTVAHLSNLQLLARSLVVPGSPKYNDSAVASAAIKSLDYWLDKDFTNPNWWWNQIGAPRSLAQTLLLLEDRLNDSQKRKGAEIVARAKIGMTGANLVDVAFITLMRALFEHDPDLVAEAVNSITNEIRVTTGEGIQPDWSFHQHGAVVYNHGYGAVFMDNCSELAAIVNGTQFAFSKEKIDLLNGLILDGTAWMIRYDTKDYGATGRGISRRAGSGGSASYLDGIVANMLALDSGRVNDYRRLATYLDGGKPAFTGNRHFYRSDFMTHQRPGWYASARMFSDRLLNTDKPHNREGLFSHHLGDGCTYIMRSGREYHNIFPLWDWWRIPGTTVELTPELTGEICRTGTRPFVGGVSNGTYGAAGFDFERDGLTARKAWFFFDDEFVCLGTGINSKSEFDVITTVNQCFLDGEVIHGGSAAPAALPHGSHNLKGNNWFYHDGVTYVFPQKADVTLTNDTVTGNWWRINNSYNKDKITGDVFTLTIGHGKNPSDASYSYIVAPGIGKDKATAYASQLPVRTLANTKAIQAVAHTGLGVTGAVLYEAGTVAIPGGTTVAINIPCILLVRMNDGKCTVTAANPLNTAARATVTFTGAYNGKTVIDLPGGDIAGSSVTVIVPRSR